MPKMNLNSMAKSELIDKINTLVERVDGWSNLFTGMGQQNRDKKTGGYFLATPKLDYQTLSDLYTVDGMSKRVIDVPIFDMVRKGYKVTNDLEDNILKASRKLKFMSYVKEALTWQDVFGGAIMIMGINDGGEVDSPLNENNIRNIDFLRVYDKWQTIIGQNNLYDDPSKDKYGQVEIYCVNPVFGGQTFSVHETRILRFDGVMVPDNVRNENDYWGDSRYQAYYDRLEGLGNAYKNVETIIEEFIMSVMGVQDLQNMLMRGEGDSILKRLKYLDMSKHINNTILMDSEEKFERISATVTGLEGLVTKLENALSAITGITVSRLFGQSPKGLNASGAENAQIEQYFDMIDTMRTEKMKGNIERFVYLLMISKEGPTKGKIIEDWAVEMPPLQQQTEKEKVDMRKYQAETDKIYIETGVLSANEVAVSRFLGMEYSIDTHISESHESMIEVEDRATSVAAKEGVFTSQTLKKPEESETISEEIPWYI